MLNKLGSFILLISLLSLLMFFASDFSGNTEFGLFFGGILGLYLAYIMTRKKRHSSDHDEESQRFRMIKKLSRRGKQKE